MKLHSFANAVDKHSVSCGYVSMGLVAIKALIYIYIYIYIYVIIKERDIFNDDD